MKVKKYRKAFVAGKFYPATDREIGELLDSVKARNTYKGPTELAYRNLIGAILPHAGHIYSAYQTLPVFEFLRKEKTEIESFVILHPLHRGGNPGFASDTSNFWETPLGEILVDDEFLTEMGIHRSDHLLDYEHSAEVIIPYIQYFGFGKTKIIPVGLSNQNPENARQLGRKLEIARKKTNRKIFIIASSDFSHFLSPQNGSLQDQKVIDSIRSGDIESVYNTIVDENISVCGYGPTMTLMDYSANNYPGYKSEILARGHSGQVHPSSEVVDYISFIFFS